jgi:hypothetical protein
MMFSVRLRARGSDSSRIVFTFTSNDGRKQAVLTVNEDGSTLAKRANTLLFKTIEKAYCTAGDDDHIGHISPPKFSH